MHIRLNRARNFLVWICRPNLAGRQVRCTVKLASRQLLSAILGEGPGESPGWY